MLAVLMSVTPPTAGHRPPGAALYRAYEVLALCLEHAEQLPRATCFLFSNCQFMAVMNSYLEQPKPQVVPLIEGPDGRALLLQQAHRQTAGALLLVRKGLDWAYVHSVLSRMVFWSCQHSL